MSRQFKTIAVSWATEKSPFAVLSLARPKQKNALNLQMYHEVGDALVEIGKDARARGVILTGQGDYYSSGNDLANFSQLMHPRTMAANAKEVCYTFVDAFVTFPKPMIAAVNGPSIGIATTTLGLCDVRICTPSATFNTPFKKLGQAPEGCSSFMFPRILGEQVARDLLDGGATLTANEALKVKFVSEVVPAEKLLERAFELSQMELKRFTTAEPELLAKLQATNRNEVEILERKWVSEECFTALEGYLRSRNKSGPANVLWALNRMRFLWDR